MPIAGSVLIAGAGIGGLALGCALQRAGIPCPIFERAPEFNAAGAGIVIQTAALLALRQIGLDTAVERAGHALARGVGKNASGVLLSSARLDELGAPPIAIHRARLQAVLLAEVKSELVHTSKTLVGYEEDEHAVRVFFSDGTNASGGLLIGADGLNSAVRRQLLGDTPLRYAGYTSWRGVAPRAGFGPAHEALEVWGRGLRFGIVPIADDETYWFAVANAPVEDPMRTAAGRCSSASRASVRQLAHWSMRRPRSASYAPTFTTENQLRLGRAGASVCSATRPIRRPRTSAKAGAWRSKTR